MDLSVDGEHIPAVIQNTKQGLVFAFNRETGEPIWPIEDRPVMQTEVPGNYTSPTQPYPTWPEPVDPIVLNGITEEFVVDYTPELKEQALAILDDYRIGGLYVPALPVTYQGEYINNVGCVGGGNIIPHPPVADPVNGLMFNSHRRTCIALGFMRPSNGIDRDNPNYPEPGEGGATPNKTPTTGVTVVDWVPGRGGGLPTIDGLPLYKRMNNQLTAYQMNQGGKVWSIPIGETPESIKNHPLLQGVDVPNSGGAGWSIQMVVGDLLVQTRALSQGMAQMEPDAPLTLNARDKFTGELLAQVPLPAPAQYGMMTYMHDGVQYIVVQIGSSRTDFPGALVAYRLGVD
jgi:quinoprotein glucose dehydrogenase